MVNLRPAWAALDPRWRAAVDALTPEDMAWIERQWETAGGAAPEVDTTWLTYEPAGQFPAVIVLMVIALIAASVGYGLVALINA